MSIASGGAGGVIDTSSTIQTSETVTPLPGWVALGRVAGTDGSALQLSSTGQLVYPNSKGVVVVPYRDVAALRAVGWAEVVTTLASTPPTGVIPVGPLSTVYTASLGWYPRAQVVTGELSLLSSAPNGTSLAGVPMSLLRNDTDAVVATSVTDGSGNFSLSTAALPQSAPGLIATTALTVQAAGGAVAAIKTQQ